jgi:cytochrome c biogenesis protein CcdA
MEEFLINSVQNYGLYAIFASFAIGVLTSLAPCSIVTLPLLVGSAISLSREMEEREKRRFMIQYSSLFVLGLVLSFSILMLLVSKIGLMLSVAPFWAYLLASLSTFLVVAFALGWIGAVDKQKISQKLLPLKLYGAVIIGMIFGLVSSPCASAPLVVIVTVADNSGWVYSYFLVLAFALGHGIFLLLAGVSLGFAQSVISNQKIAKITQGINNFFILLLVIIAFYFLYQSYQLF